VNGKPLVGVGAADSSRNRFSIDHFPFLIAIAFGSGNAVPSSSFSLRREAAA
jgi:hypothetical protein